ncbi:MAG: peroxiredoxin [Erythrobacter sp. RIFCSPHIGHO2_12_FULL_63_10]|nr:MAG: peroxiredoxin [Erythrobacter sp. RIFCSPHIGHO2_12_FULL_63_10]
MTILWKMLGVIALGALAGPVAAELPVDARAPVFATQAALAGKETGFSLSAALARGPVVLYFYPKAFTQGCTLEANAFAEAMDQFAAMGATVIGLSADDIDTLKEFSVLECRNAFPVGVASAELIKAYDVSLVREGKDLGVTSRTSYVIAPNGRIAMVHSDMDYRDHVRLSLEAVKKLAR